MKISVLDDRLVNRIAAGEVVERPASVVRELVDNSVDAGADDITIWIEAGGRSLIKINDNGCGMEHDDAILAFERHATSKITSTDDLDAIRTLGFRGEALSSIASVTRMNLQSRTTESEAGTEVIIEGGLLKNVKSCAMPVGTTITARRLFFNTPARRKFLKQPRTEERRVKTWLKQYALAHPEVRFRLFCDGKEAVNFGRRDSSLARARDQFRGSLVEVHYSGSNSDISGLIAHPSMAQYESAAFVLLVNGRVVSDRLLLKAVREGFDSTLKEREYPVGFIRLDVAPDLIDVNVHPQKSEVRFKEPGVVFNLVKEAIGSAVTEFRAPVAGVSRFSHTPRGSAALQLNSQSDTLPLLPQSGPVLFKSSRNDMAADTAVAGVGAVVEDALESAPETAAVETSDFRYTDLRYIGQALDCYLFCECDGVLYVLDMHAAHERYNYNIIRERYEQRAVQSQQLLMPLSVELTETGLSSCLDNEILLNRFGFEVEAFGESTLLVRSMPAIMAEKNVPELMKEIAAIAIDEVPGGELTAAVLEKVVDHISARIACHASIRSGKKMEKAEVYSLLSALDGSEFSSACPHGRPIAVAFKGSEIERWFGRDK